MSGEIIKGFELCPEGCGLSHREGSPAPFHDPTWLEAERQLLLQWVVDLQAGMFVNCVYCGHRYGPRESGATVPEAGETMAEALRRHVESCPEHPMSALRAELRERDESMAAVRGELGVMEHKHKVACEDAVRCGDLAATRLEALRELEASRQALMDDVDRVVRAHAETNAELVAAKRAHGLALHEAVLRVEALIRGKFNVDMNKVVAAIREGIPAGTWKAPTPAPAAGPEPKGTRGGEFRQGDGRLAWRCSCGCVNLAEFRKRCVSCGAERAVSPADPYALRERAHGLARLLEVRLTCNFEGWKSPHTRHDWKCDDIVCELEGGDADGSLAAPPSVAEPGAGPLDPIVWAQSECHRRGRFYRDKATEAGKDEYWSQYNRGRSDEAHTIANLVLSAPPETLPPLPHDPTSTGAEEEYLEQRGYGEPAPGDIAQAQRQGWERAFGKPSDEVLESLEAARARVRRLGEKERSSERDTGELRGLVLGGSELPGLCCAPLIGAHRPDCPNNAQPAPPPGGPALPCHICHMVGTHSMGCDYGGKGLAVPVTIGPALPDVPATETPVCFNCVRSDELERHHYPTGDEYLRCARCSQATRGRLAVLATEASMSSEPQNPSPKTPADVDSDAALPCALCGGTKRRTMPNGGSGPCPGCSSPSGPAGSEATAAATSEAGAQFIAFGGIGDDPPAPPRDIPRRIRLDLNVPAELAIRAATDAVEGMGADVRLTEAVVLLGRAREQVSDFVDAQDARNREVKP